MMVDTVHCHQFHDSIPLLLAIICFTNLLLVASENKLLLLAIGIYNGNCLY